MYNFVPRQIIRASIPPPTRPPTPTPPASLPNMPRVSAKRRVEDDISEYLVEMADMIEMDNAPDDEILDAIDAFFDDLSYLEESQAYMATRYYSKVRDSLPYVNGAGRVDSELVTRFRPRPLVIPQGHSMERSFTLVVRRPDRVT
jgi:hypothetical protein